MKKKIYTILFLVLAITGCRQIIFWKYGMHDPQQETPQRLRSFLAGMNQPLAGQYIFGDSSSYLKFIWHPFYSKKLLRTLLFNEQGYLDSLMDPGKCQWSGGSYLLALHRDSLYHADTSIRYQSLLDSLKPLDTAGLVAGDTGRYDFTALVTWGAFIGRYNERLFVNDLAVKGNRNARIRIIYLNIDMQESWKLRPDQRLLMQ